MENDYTALTLATQRPVSCRWAGLRRRLDPGYWVSGGVVHLSGSVDQPSGTGQIFAVLPKADRPAHDLYIQVMVYTPDDTAYAATVVIDPDGAM